MKEDEIVLIKEIPEYIETESGKYQNIPEAIGHSFVPPKFFCYGEFEEDFPLLGGVKIYDPRGFRVVISIENLGNLLKNVSVVNGIIQDELYYAIEDNDRLPWHPFMRSCHKEESLWLLSDKTETKKRVSSSDLVPGNRYSYVREEDPMERHHKKKEARTVVFLGSVKRRSLLKKYEGYEDTIRIFIDVATKEVISKSEIPSFCIWYLLDEQDPSDLELMKEALDRYNNSRFGGSGEAVKLDVDDESVKTSAPWPWTVEEYIKKSKHNYNVTGRFIRKVDDQKITVLDISPLERSDRRHANNYELCLLTFQIEDGKVKCTESYNYLDWELTQGYLNSAVKDSICLCKAGEWYGSYIRVTDNFGDSSNLREIDNVCLKLE